jgi:hypothetical protein
LAAVRKQRLTKLLSDIQAAIAFDQPLLIAMPGSKGVLVSGTYTLSPTVNDLIERGPIASYVVEILFPAAFPKVEPLVREIGNAFPHDEDHHVNLDGTCCVVIWEVWASSKKNVSVQTYFDGPFRNFFLGQHQKALTGKWPFGEEPHGKNGLIEAFANLLSCSRNEEKIRYLLRLLSKDWPKGHWKCPCGSGRIVRQCCVTHLAKLHSEVPKLDAQRMLTRLKSYD